MMIYTAGRQTDKTVFLIQQSVGTGVVIMTSTCQMVGYIGRMARDLSLQVLPPITVTDWIRGFVGQCEDRDRTCLVGELQIVLSQLNVETTTLDENYKEIVCMSGVKGTYCTKHSHRDVCQYGEEYLAAQAAVDEISVNLPPRGDKSIKSIWFRGISWVESVELKRHYFHQNTGTVR